MDMDDEDDRPRHTNGAATNDARVKAPRGQDAQPFTEEDDDEDTGSIILELDKESGVVGTGERKWAAALERRWAYVAHTAGPVVGVVGALCALVFIFAVWGAIPLGDPYEDLFHEDGPWPLIFLTNPLVHLLPPLSTFPLIMDDGLQSTHACMRAWCRRDRRACR